MSVPLEDPSISDASVRSMSSWIESDALGSECVGEMDKSSGVEKVVGLDKGRKGEEREIGMSD